jgi:hypothetical protein
LLDLLIALAIGGYVAPECRVAFERFEETRTVLRLRPECPIGFPSTHAAVRQVLAETDAKELSLAFGRLERYPWLSNLLSRQASSSTRWDQAAGKPYQGHENAYVASALRGMPEFTALFDRWMILGVSVEKVLVRPAAEVKLAQGAPVPPDAKLPWDAIVWVTLRRP